MILMSKITLNNLRIINNFYEVLLLRVKNLKNTEIKDLDPDIVKNFI